MSNRWSMFNHIDYRTRRQPAAAPQFTVNPSPTPSPEPEPICNATDTARQVQVQQFHRPDRPRPSLPDREVIVLEDSPPHTRQRPQPREGYSSTARRQFGQTLTSATFVESSASCNSAPRSSNNSARSRAPSSPSQHNSSASRPHTRVPSSASPTSSRPRDYRNPPPLPPLFTSSNQTGQRTQLPIREEGSALNSYTQPVARDFRRPTSPLFEPMATTSPPAVRQAKRKGPFADSDEEEAQEFDEVDRWAQRPVLNTKRKSTAQNGVLESRRHQRASSGTAQNFDSPHVDRDHTVHFQHRETQDHTMIGDDWELPDPNDVEQRFLSDNDEVQIRSARKSTKEPKIQRKTRSGKVFRTERPEDFEDAAEDDPAYDEDPVSTRPHRIRIRHPLIANLDREVKPIPKPYYFLLRRTLRGRSWMRSPIRYTNPAVAGSPKYIVPLTLESIEKETKRSRSSKKKADKRGTAQPKSQRRSRSTLDFVDGFQDIDDVPQDSPANLSTPSDRRENLRKRPRTQTTTAIDDQIMEELQEGAKKKEADVVALTIENGDLMGKFIRLRRDFAELQKNASSLHDSPVSDHEGRSGRIDDETNQIRGNIRRLSDAVGDLDERLANGHIPPGVENNQLRGKVAGLETEVAELEKEVAEMNKKIDRLNGQLRAVYLKSALDKNQFDLENRKLTRLVEATRPATASSNTSVTEVVTNDNDLQQKYEEMQTANAELLRSYKNLEKKGIEAKTKNDEMEFVARQVAVYGKSMSNPAFGELGVALIKLREFFGEQ
ncbi:hypothetical protein EJ08DRAFT_647067 [Tothia fuscella]|uniref:Uncharacterized protein n=1 Tax=Tothia fuscella TaxID=1048955 RepID=A0A9P4NXW9_9PEZI|nr:hypothetical protein EJ08DRAFT_647067 [Tothia fuscella]